MYNTHLMRSPIPRSFFVFALFHLLLLSSSTPSDAAAITGHLLTSRTISGTSPPFLPLPSFLSSPTRHLLYNFIFFCLERVIIVVGVRRGRVVDLRVPRRAVRRPGLPAGLWRLRVQREPRHGQPRVLGPLQHARAHDLFAAQLHLPQPHPRHYYSLHESPVGSAIGYTDMWIGYTFSANGGFYFYQG